MIGEWAGYIAALMFFWFCWRAAGAFVDGALEPKP